MNTACHEASHTFVARFIGCSVKAVTIIPTNQYTGCVLIRKWKQVSAVQQAMILVAGVCSYTISGEAPDAPAVLEECREDLEAIAKLNLPKNLMDAITDYVTILLQFNWDTVALIAGELERYGSLTGREIARLMPELPETSCLEELAA